jgi:hypothetical protein
MKVKYTPSNYETAPEGVFWATLTEIKKQDGQMIPKGERDRVRFTFELDKTDSIGRPLKVFHTVPLNLHPKSMLSKLIFDLTGENPVPDEDYELNDLLNAYVQLVLKHHHADKGKVYANIVSILRPPTPKEEAEEKRVAAVTNKIKQAAANSAASAEQKKHGKMIVFSAPVPAPVEAGAITDEDIPF